MKKKLFIKLILLIFASTLLINSCSKDDGLNGNGNTVECGTYNGHQLYKGPQGGCYYINSNDNKTYVDRSYCNCD